METLDLLPTKRGDLQEIAETVDFMEVVEQPKRIIHTSLKLTQRKLIYSI